MMIATHFRGNNSPNIKSNILFLSLSNAAPAGPGYIAQLQDPVKTRAIKT